MPLHLFLVHFPVALIVVGAAADVVGAALQSREARRWAGVLLILGALFAVAAFLTGQSALAALGPFRPESFARVETHTQWGGAGVWALAIAGGLRAAWRGRLEGVVGWVTLGLAVLSAVLVIAISTSGTAIAHG
jgi:uncharacterized membrane protein